MNKKYYVGDKICGELIDEIYMTKRVAKIHYYVVGKGYPISDNILQQLKKDGCNKIIILEVRSNGKIREWSCPLILYLNAPIFKHNNYDGQRCVSLQDMELMKR